MYSNSTDLSTSKTTANTCSADLSAASLKRPYGQSGEGEIKQRIKALPAEVIFHILKHLSPHLTSILNFGQPIRISHVLPLETQLYWSNFATNIAGIGNTLECEEKIELHSLLAFDKAISIGSILTIEQRKYLLLKDKLTSRTHELIKQ